MSMRWAATPAPAAVTVTPAPAAATTPVVTDATPVAPVPAATAPAPAAAESPAAQTHATDSIIVPNATGADHAPVVAETGAGHAPVAPAPNASARIEIADLKERIRKLEAIAAGVEL